MTYTRSAIGLLTRQYRSVLRKCFLINCGLFALGAVSVADAAAPKPTLDDLQSKTEEKISILGTYLGTYALTELGSSETAPAGTTAISFNGKRYYYTTPTTLDADKTNMLKYLSGSTAVAMTSTGATAANSVFSISGTNYTFDKTKLPVSVWTPIDGTASDYDYYTYADDNITKEYHKFSFKENDKIVWTDNGSTAIGSYPNAYVSGSNATVSGNTITGAIRMKMPHNGIAPTDWNRYFTYTYTKPTDYQITQTRLNDNVTADNVNLKVFTKISNTSDGAIYMSFGDSFTNIETTGGAIRNAKTINEIESDFIGNELKVNGFSDSCGGWCGADGIGFGGAINNMGTIDTITGNFVANNVYRTSTNNYAALGLGGAISNLNGTTISIIGNFVGNSATGTLGYGGAISNASMTDNGKDTTIVSIIGDFIGNKASGAGGAISNMSQYFGKKATISSITGDFIGNSADYYGGAIFNGTANPFTTNACYPEYASGTTLTLANTTFINNGANNKPNSIYNAGVINIANGATVTINDGYDGLSQGQLKVGISASSGSILNLSVDNGVLQTDNLGTVTNNGTMNWDLDVDLIDTNSDKITVTSLSGTQSIIINTINLITGTGSDGVSVTLTDNDTLKVAYTLSADILNNITKADGVTYDVQSVTYDSTTGILHFNGGEIPLILGDATIDTIHKASEEYLANAHENYTVATEQGSNTDFVVINGTKYYFTPNEGSDAKNTALVNLAHSGMDALITGTSSDYVFYDGTTYWTYDKKKLPVSVWTPIDGTSSDYDYITYADDGITKEYHKFTFKDNPDNIVTFSDGTSSGYDLYVSFGNSKVKYYKITVNPSNTSHLGEKATWSEPKTSAPSGYEWINNKVAGSNVTVGTNTVTGAIRLKKSKNFGTNNALNPTAWKVWYTYIYTKPNDYINDIQTTRINDTLATTDIDKEVFAGISGSSSGGAIYNTQNLPTKNIIADFVGNSNASGKPLYGGAISNYTSSGTVSLDSIIGDFVGNNNTSNNTYSTGSSYGGAISNYTGSGSASINNVVGDFLGNSTTTSVSRGGAISNYAQSQSAIAVIGNIMGDFVGNVASDTTNSSAYGGAISNYADAGTAKIGNIVGNFISNYSSIYPGNGGAISNYAYTGMASIDSMIGDFVGNVACGSGMSSGGALFNSIGSSGTASIGSITGNFIDNLSYSSSSSPSTANGGAIHNGGSISSVTGDFIGNSSFSSYGKSSGGAINNSGSISSVTGDFIGNSSKLSSSSSLSSNASSNGGAIYNGGSSASIGSIVGNFIGNLSELSSSSSSSSPTSTSSGGAIYNGSIIGSIKGDFIGNSITVTISNAPACGGAICNVGGSINSIVGDFIGNNIKSGKVYGGAIFNGTIVSGTPQYSVQSVIVLGGNIFTGNYANNNKNPNSIYNSGIINIEDGKAVTINDGYDGLDEAQLNIGDSVFNLSVDNGVLQTDNLGTVTNNGTMNWDLDVDLIDTNSDKITVTSLSGTQSIIINTINLITGTGSDGVSVTLTDNDTLKVAYTLSADILNNITKADGVTYDVQSVTYDSTTGILHFNGGAAVTLVTMIAKNAADKEYTIAADGELVEANLDTLVNNKLTVTGNGSTDKNWVKGSNTYTGVTLGAGSEDQTFEVKNIAEWSGFADTAITTGAKGTLNIENAHFSGNTTADVNNGGTMNLTGTNSFDKIIGDGATELKSGTTTVGSLAQGTLTVTSGTLVNNGASTVGGGSNAGTIQGTGSLATTGAFENKSGATISQAVSHSGTGTNAFTNNGTISGAVTNSGTFANNSSITGNVTNTGTMTSAADNLGGTIANNGSGVLNLSGALTKNISGTGTTYVNSTLAMNSGAGVAGTLNMNSGTVTVSNGEITSHNVGELKGNGNIVLDINYGDEITSDTITVTNDTQDATLKISSINETGTRAANFEKQILFGTTGSTKLDISELSGWNGSTNKQEEIALTSNTLAYNADLGTKKWTETTELSVIGSAEGLQDTLKYTTTISNIHFDPKAENLTAINNYSGTGSEDRKINFTGIQEAAGGIYTMQASTSLGTTAAGKLTLDGEKSSTGALTTVDLNGNAGYNLNNATEIVLDEVKLTGASGNVITASNDGASVTLNDAYVDGDIVKSGGNKMNVTTSGTTTLNGDTTNVSLSNSGDLTNNGMITGDVTNTGTMTSSADNLGGAIANNGSGVLNLSGTLAKNISGTGTTKVDTSLTLNAGAGIAGTVDMNNGEIDMSGNDAYDTYNIGSLNNDGFIKIDAKAATEESDQINTTAASTGSNLTISALNLDTTGLTEGVDYTQTMSLVSGNTSGISISFGSGVDTPYNQTGIAIPDIYGTDSVMDKDVVWDETFGDWKKSGTKDTTLTLNGTDMIYTVTNTYGPKVYIAYSEGLKELNQFDAGTETKTFVAPAAGLTHTVLEDLGVTVGEISVDGQNGTLDFDGHKGFVMNSGTEVSLKDVTTKNTNGLADVKAGATLNLTNVSLEGNDILQNAGTINLNGTNSIDSIIAGTATTATLNVNSDWTMDTTVTGHTINLNGSKLTVGAGNLVATDNLNVKEDAEIDVAGNKINLNQVNFESGSKLSLKVNSLENYGSIVADNITIEEGAQLSATLAQGIGTGTVQLLQANNTNFNNFADSFDNNMYIFEKADKNGLYNIKLVKTAEEVSREAGGTETEARAAGAWVDGDAFAEGSTAAEVADALADLAQNDAAGLNEALSVVTPTETPLAQVESTEMNDKLLLTVDKYLSQQDIGGLSSGDLLPDVTLWAKGYYGKSKLNNHGKVRGFDTKNKGVIVGADKKVTSAVKVGVGFQYNDSDIDAHRRNVDVDTLTGFVYGEYRPSNWFVSGVASLGKSDYDEKKYAIGKKITDNYSANIYSLQALTGYDLKYATPEVGARYYRIKRHGYEDSIGQKVSGKDMDLLRGVLGVHSSYTYGIFKPEVYAGVTYDFVSDEDNAIVSLPNGSSYAVDGKRMKRFGTEFSASVTAEVNDNTSVLVGYEGKFRSHYQDHSGMVNMKYEF